MAKKIKLSGTRPEAQNGLQDFQKANGNFDPYAVSPVEDTQVYTTKANKQGLTHVDDAGKKHAWPLGALSREAENGKVEFLDKEGEPVKVGEDFATISVPNRIGRDAMGMMLA